MGYRKEGSTEEGKGLLEGGEGEPRVTARRWAERTVRPQQDTSAVF